MAMTSFTKKLLRTASAGQLQAIASSTRDLDLLFKFMVDKSVSVREAAASNPLRLSSDGIRRELAIRAESGDEKSVLKYVLAFDKDFVEEDGTAGIVFDFIKARPDYEALALEICKRLYNKTPLTRRILRDRVPGAEGKPETFFAGHPFLQALTTAEDDEGGTRIDVLIDAISFLAGEGHGQMARRAAFALKRARTPESLDRAHAADVLMVLLENPDLLRAEIEVTGGRVMDLLAKWTTNWQRVEDAEVANILLAEIRRQARPALVAEFASQRALAFTWDELIAAAEGPVSEVPRASRALARLIEEYDPSRRRELIEIVLRRDAGSEAASYLRQVAREGALSLADQALAFELYGARMVPPSEALRELFAQDMVAGRQRAELQTLAMKGSLSPGQYQVLWDFGMRTRSLYLTRNAVDLAVEHFSPEDLWEAMRAAGVSRKATSRDLRRRLQSMVRAKAGSTRGGAAAKAAQAVDDDLDDEFADDLPMTSEEATESAGGDAPAVADYEALVRETPLPGLAALLRAHDPVPRALLLEVCRIIDAEGDSEGAFTPDCADELFREIGRLTKALDRPLGDHWDKPDKKAFKALFKSVSDRLVRELLAEDFAAAVKLARDSYRKIRLSIDEAARAIASDGEGEDDEDDALQRVQKVASLIGEIPDGDLSKVLALCRSKVESERVLGFRVLPRVMGRLPAKDVARAILRSEEGNKKVNALVHQIAEAGDEIGSGVFLLLSYVKELYFDHSPVLAAEFLDKLVTGRVVSSAVMCEPEYLYGFVSLTRRVSANHTYLLALLADKTRKGAMFAKDAGAAFLGIPSEKKDDAVKILRGALKGDRVWPAGVDYDLLSLEGLHDALTFLGKKYSEENYSFATDDTPEHLRRLYASPIAAQGITITYGASEEELGIKLVTESHELIALGDICDFCIGNGAYAKAARKGQEVHFALSRPDRGYVGACTFKTGSWEPEHMMWAQNKAIQGGVKEAIIRAVTNYIAAVVDGPVPVAAAG